MEALVVIVALVAFGAGVYFLLKKDKSTPSASSAPVVPEQPEKEPKVPKVDVPRGTEQP